MPNDVARQKGVISMRRTFSQFPPAGDKQYKSMSLSTATTNAAAVYGTGYKGGETSREKPEEFKCKMCSKKFKKRDYLIKHTRTHTGERPYMCKICHRGFTVKSNLNRHLHIIHGKRNF